MSNQETGPLAGLRVLDIGTNIAGPFGGTLLAEFGAEVIKVEVPDIGDPGRGYGPFYNEKSLTWLLLARNKKSITLNLREKKGQEILKKLVEISDLVIENFRPGTLEKWGLGYDELKQTNPRIILSRVSGFGQDGPYRHRAAFDRVAIGMGGLTHVTGHPDRPPVRAGINIADQTAALFSALGSMIALYHRDVHGRPEGQWIDVSLTESIIRLLESIIPECDKLGIIRERDGNQNVTIAPADNFSTKDGKWVVFVVTSDPLFQRFARAIGREDLLEDPRFETNQLRVENRDALHAVVRDWFRSKTVSEIQDILEPKGLPFGLVYNARDILDDPQNKARGSIIEVDDPEIGPVKVQNVIPRLSETPGRIRSGPPRLGQHNTEIYQGHLGFSKEELEALKAEGII
jgi:crotonobetainyl-CoA:carnitine CoA-transferase CaiB-like acyl-CoA transferase